MHLLTLETWSETSYLLRLENYYAKGQDAELSKDATVSLKVSVQGRYPLEDYLCQYSDATMRLEIISQGSSTLLSKDATASLKVSVLSHNLLDTMLLY